MSTVLPSAVQWQSLGRKDIAVSNQENSSILSGSSFRRGPVGHIVGVEHWVGNVFVWEKYFASPDGKPVLILAHGSTSPGCESFDLQVPGQPSYSMMNFLAAEGFDVFASDVQGFSRSRDFSGGHLLTFAQ